MYNRSHKVHALIGVFDASHALDGDAVLVGVLDDHGRLPNSVVLPGIVLSVAENQEKREDYL